MKIRILDKTKKRKFIDAVSGLGIEKIPGLLLKGGKERVNVFSGGFSSEELLALWRILPVEGLGLYLGKEIVNKRTGEKEARLSLDGLHLLKNQVKKNIVKLDKEQEEKWWRGGDVGVGVGQVEEIKGGSFVAVMGIDEDFIGTGKLTMDKTMVMSFLPKERRVRN